MWVGQNFAEDTNDTLKVVQHDLWFHRDGAHLEYGSHNTSSCGFIFGYARDIYLQKWKAGPLFYPEIVGLKEKSSFDHRVLQYAHDLMAAYYRWLVRHEDVPALANTPQLYRRYLLERWVHYIQLEMNDLADSSDDAIEAIVTAVVYENTEKGYKAEDKLCECLTQRYKGPFTDARDEWDKQAMAECEQISQS